MNDNLLNRIHVQIKKSYYASSRYKVPQTFAMLYHEKPLSVVELAQYVRVSDHLIGIDEHHYFITFAYTAQDDAYKAAQNLVYQLDRFFNDASCCVAIDTYDVSNSPTIVLNRLSAILEKSKKSPFSRVEDETILDESMTDPNR